ncbi:caspase family protein [Candidatus Pelagibacter sp.]|nr:caspase family protein [Candidatus Pelagibacter sp.]
MKTMNFYQSIFQNNILKIIKYLSLIILIFVLSFKANTEIPEKYKIETTLPNCKGTDYKKWTNCYGEYKFPRLEYKGEWKDGKLHGKGILREAWGAIYVGDFENNLAHGYGRQEDPDGSWFEGEIKNDKLNGKGIWVSSRGDRYEGNFVDMLLDGQGIYTTTEGIKVTGEFKKDFLNGQGKWEYANGDVATGNYKDDQLNGYGVYIWTNGDKYEGEWVDGERTGKGTYYFGDGGGGYYEGNFYKNEKSGQGKQLYEVGGDIYDGTWKNDLRDGKGEYIYSNGNKFIGSWVKDYEDGYGVFTWSDGDKYEGEWVDGYRTGKGTYTYRSGTIYKGDFVNNYSEGNGTMTYADGTKYIGEFLLGNEHGQGSIEYQNGDRYVGQFKDAYEHGQGKMVYANGDIYEGLWENGKEAEGKTTLTKFNTNEKYYALIIGNNDYKKLEDLDNAVNDAKDLEKVLKEKYGFETTLLLNQTSDETEDAIIAFTENREKNDNILIYYAGHGQKIKKQKLERGYWLPTDAGSKRDSKWISNSNIKDYIGSSDAKHILLIVDSCFSGSLMRGSGENKSVEKLTQNTVERLQSKVTRLVITSGGNERVADGIGDSKNSVFAVPLIKTLKNNNDVIRSIELFQEVQNYVINNADQTPNHSLIHGTGHDGGEFLFFPRILLK